MQSSQWGQALFIVHYFYVFAPFDGASWSKSLFCNVYDLQQLQTVGVFGTILFEGKQIRLKLVY